VQERATLEKERQHLAAFGKNLLKTLKTLLRPGTCRVHAQGSTRVQERAAREKERQQLRTLCSRTLDSAEEGLKQCA